MIEEDDLSLVLALQSAKARGCSKEHFKELARKQLDTMFGDDMPEQTKEYLKGKSDGTVERFWDYLL